MRDDALDCICPDGTREKMDAGSMERMKFIGITGGVGAGKSEILPWLPSFPERFLLQSMRVFRRLCRQIELDFAAAREIVLPCGFGGAGMLVIQWLFAPKLSTPERRLRADFAFCWR